MLTEAVERLSAAGLPPVTASSIFETEPQGRRDQDWFLNCVVAIETEWSPTEILACARRIETVMGRRRLRHWGPRTIDIDILVYGDAVMRTPQLTLPHPRLHERAFALVPLAMLAPHLELPGHGLVSDLASRRAAEEGQGLREWGPLPLLGHVPPTPGPVQPGTAPPRGATRSRLLQALRNAPAGVSGQRLAEDLGVSRAAVWKHIQRLRQDGYSIHGTAGSGYCLQTEGDVLSLESLAGHAPRTIGRVIHVLRSVDSTNATARQLALEGSSEGTVVLAEEQTKGRGRNGRGFLSPPGGVYLSVVLRPDIPPAAATRFTLLTAVAVSEALEESAGLAPHIKWPNDILLADSKVAGILLELAGREDRVEFIVAGVGINVLSAPDGVPAVAVIEQAAHPVTRADVARAVLDRLDTDYALYTEGKWPEILSAWRDRCVTLGQLVRVHTIHGVIEGHALDVTEDGALLVRVGTDTQVVLAGDVEHLRSAQ